MGVSVFVVVPFLGEDLQIVHHDAAFALQQHHLVTEGAGAVGIAALLHQRVSELGHNVAVVVSGGNVSLPVLMEVAKERGNHHIDRS